MFYSGYVANYSGSDTSGNIGDHKFMGYGEQPTEHAEKSLGSRKLFQKKQPGSPGKLGKTSTKAESLSKLRGKGALA